MIAQRVARFISTLSLLLDRQITRLVMVLLFGLAGLLGLGVFYRYILNDSIYWSNEVARYLMVYIVFLGATMAHRHRAHIRIDLMLNRFSSVNKRRVEQLISLLFLGFWIMILSGSVQLFPMFMLQKTATLDLPFAVPFAALPISAIIWILYSVDDLFHTFGSDT